MLLLRQSAGLQKDCQFFSGVQAWPVVLLLQRLLQFSVVERLFFISAVPDPEEVFDSEV